MAHAGTPMDLAKQPAATGSSGFWRALITAIVIVAIGVTLVLAASFVAGANPAKGVPAANDSYTQYENSRGASPMSVTQEDRSYDSIEKLRGEAAGSGGSVDLNQLTPPRGNMTLSGTSGGQGADPGRGLHGQLP